MLEVQKSLYSPCPYREALREPAMLISRRCLLKRGDKIKCLHSI